MVALYQLINPFIADPVKALPYWSNPPFLIFGIRALWRSRLSARAPECKKIKNGGLDQHGAEPYEQQQFGTAGVEGVKSMPYTNSHGNEHASPLPSSYIKCYVTNDVDYRPLQRAPSFADSYRWNQWCNN